MRTKSFLKKGYLFKLIDFSEPLLKDNRMIYDNKVGGVILKYKVKDVIYVTLFKKERILYTRTTMGIYGFFNPLKFYWRKDAYKISKIYWGRKNNPLTNLWLEVYPEFKDINSIALSELKKIKQCLNRPLIKHLSSRDEFFIISNI